MEGSNLRDFIFGFDFHVPFGKLFKFSLVEDHHVANDAILDNLFKTFLIL